MRKLVASGLVSVDGVVESPEEWQLPYYNDEMSEEIGAAMEEADAMLLGRVTYEEWAGFWPSQSGEDQPFADYMNDTPKYVVSRPPRSPSGGTTRRRSRVTSRTRSPSSSGSRARTSGSPPAPPSSGRCCKRTSSSNAGSWSIP
jgi:dihydrofolate reductase